MGPEQCRNAGNMDGIRGFCSNEIPDTTKSPPPESAVDEPDGTQVFRNLTDM